MMCEWGAALEAAGKNKEQAWEDESVTMSVAAKTWSEWECTTEAHATIPGGKQVHV